jgi:hypothetical protein
LKKENENLDRIAQGGFAGNQKQDGKHQSLAAK